MLHFICDFVAYGIAGGVLLVFLHCVLEGVKQWRRDYKREHEEWKNHKPRYRL